MDKKATSALVRDRGRRRACLKISGQRAGEIEIEVERLNRAASDAAAQIDFNDEPSHFTALLRAYRHAVTK